MRRHAVPALASGLLLASCTQGAVGEAKRIAAENLLDPEAAQFRGLRTSRTSLGTTVCGEINGKNSYGAYVGFKRFYVGLDDKIAAYEPASQHWGLASSEDFGEKLRFDAEWAAYCKDGK